jgi:PhoH-like ATPase
MSKSKKKIFVLDTNVILHDSSCIDHFQENDIVIPITVLEELDQFKKGNESLNYHAREFLRNLDTLSGDRIFKTGVKIGPELGNIIIKLESDFDERINLDFSRDKPDHRILNIAFLLANENPNRSVILVSKDVNLRMKAKSIGLLAQDYKSDQVSNISSLYKGHRTVECPDESLIQALQTAPFQLDPKQLFLDHELIANEYLTLSCGTRSVLAVNDAFLGKIRRIDKTSAYGINPRNVEQNFALDALMNEQIQLVTLSGKAGTGKTLLALAAALQKRKLYRQIFLARPVVALSNKDLGFLPGDVQSKIDPYMQPLYDNLGVIKMNEPDTSKQKVDRLLEEGKLLISALAYIRGRSLVKIFFIVDEAQNLTPHEIKTIITRAGEGTKIIFTGDIFQIDHPYLDSQSNGLSYMIEKMQGQKLYSHVTLEKGERSELADLASNLL